MKRLFLLVCVTAFGVAVVLGQGKKADSSSDDAARAAAVKLFKSLTNDQKKLALTPLDDKERYKDRLVGIVKEYEAKGVPVHWLANDFQQRPPSIAFFGSEMAGSPMDELYQFRELAYHVDARDHLITIY